VIIKKIVDEHTEQVNYFKMLENLRGKYTQLILAHSIPNGGLRNKAVAKKLKDEGVKSGVPDIFIPIPKDGYHGLYIEMKKTKQWHISDNQKFWLNYLNEIGYCAIVCRGAIEAFESTKNYLDGSIPVTETYNISKHNFLKKGGLSKQYTHIANLKGWIK
jgi:hypothetical protein